MSKYSLRKAFYSNNNSILNEMAIITQTSFIDRIINIVKKKPKIAGGNFSSFEEIQKNVEDSNLDKKEVSLLQEIIKCVNYTGLLNLTGKENKKARKQSEVLIIKQFRKYKNIDGSSIDFKGVLPLFDNIADYLEKKGDVSFDDCIMAADVYMRRFYNLANDEEKQEISKGNFDFSIIFNKTNFYSNYIKSNMKSTGDDVIDLFEDDKMKVVYPTTPQAFNRTIILSGINLEDIDWCTRSANTWYSYTSRKYVAIAINKKADEEAWDKIFSLKVRFDGTIDENDTCDRENEHCNQSIIDDYFSAEAVTTISKLPEIAKDYKIAGKGNFDEYIKGFANLNDFESLIEIFVRVLSSQTYDSAIEYFKDFCKLENVSRDQAAKVIAESISFYMFDNPNEESYKYDELVKFENDYPVIEILNYFKEIITKNGSHARYFNTLLSLNPYTLDGLLDFNDICNALQSSLNTTNTNNFRRVIDTFLTNTNINYYLNPKSIANKNAGLTQRNIIIYSIIYNTKAMETYIKESSIDIVKYANPNRTHTFESFIALLAIRQPDDLIEKINKNNPESPVTLKDVDKKLILTYLSEDFGHLGEKSTSNDKSKKFLSLSIEEYKKIREELFVNLDTLKNVINDSDTNFRKLLISYILKCLKEGSTNPFGLEKNDNTLNSLDTLLSYDDYDLAYMTEKIAFRFPFELSEFSNTAIQSISNILMDDLGLRSNSEIYTRILSQNISSLTAQNLLTLLSCQETNRKIQIILIISSKMWRSIEEISFISEFLEKVIDISLEDNETQKLINQITSPHSHLHGHYILNYLMPAAICSCNNISSDIKSAAFLKIVKTYYDNSSINNITSSMEDAITRFIYSIDESSIDTQNIIDLIISDKKMQRQAIHKFLYSHIGVVIISKIIMLSHNSGIVIPKSFLSNILIKSKSVNGIQPSRGLTQAIFSNFINKSIDGDNFLHGHDLALVRNTLLTLFKKLKNIAYFSRNEYEEIAKDCVKKLNPSAKKQMAIVFPEIKDELFAWSKEESEEIKVDSLIRQYVKMLLS